MVHPSQLYYHHKSMSQFHCLYIQISTVGFVHKSKIDVNLIAYNTEYALHSFFLSKLVCTSRVSSSLIYFDLFVRNVYHFE